MSSLALPFDVCATRKFRHGASRAERLRSCCHFRAGALCRRLAVWRQSFFELLFDTEGIGGGVLSYDALGFESLARRFESCGLPGEILPARHGDVDDCKICSPGSFCHDAVMFQGGTIYVAARRPALLASSLLSTASSKSAYHPIATLPHTADRAAALQTR